MIEQEFAAHLNRMGYSELRELPDGRVIGLQGMLYTTGLFVGLDRMSYAYRYCYENYALAQTAFERWDGTDHPPGPWIKRKGLDPEILGPGATNP